MTQEEVFRGLQTEVAQLQEEEARLLRVTVDAQALEIERLRAQVLDLQRYMVPVRDALARSVQQIREMLPASGYILSAPMTVAYDTMRAVVRGLSLEIDRDEDEEGSEPQEEAEEDSDHEDIESMTTGVSNLNEAIEQESESDEDL